MNSKRSMWKLLFAMSGAGLLVTNCTLKTDSDSDGGSCTEGKTKTGCVCPDESEGFQTCLASGVYGSCTCEGANVGGGSNGGGSSSAGSAGETYTAGYAGATPVGDAGAGGEGPVAALDCGECLVQNCAMEWDACAAEDENNPFDPAVPSAYCFSSDVGVAPGQMEFILDCISAERANGTAKRDAVRGCGASLGGSSNPSNFKWPPDGMTPATEGLMNCMADKPDEVANPGAWATDPANFPSGVPAPWVDGTCAKTSCTARIAAGR